MCLCTWSRPYIVSVCVCVWWAMRQRLWSFVCVCGCVCVCVEPQMTTSSKVTQGEEGQVRLKVTYLHHSTLVLRLTSIYIETQTTYIWVRPHTLLITPLILVLLLCLLLVVDVVHWFSDLREAFRKSPLSLGVNEGESAVFECDPPKGHPTPVVTWRLDGRDLILPRHRSVWWSLSEVRHTSCKLVMVCVCVCVCVRVLVRVSLGDRF